MNSENCHELYVEFLALKDKSDATLRISKIMPHTDRVIGGMISFEEGTRLREIAYFLEYSCTDCLKLTRNDWFEIKKYASTFEPKKLGH